MVRRLYLVTLVCLQVALLMHAAPPLARAMRIGSAMWLHPGAGFAAAYFVALGLAAAGFAIALCFPAIALARHRRRGALRFTGLPAWPVAMAIVGTATFTGAMLASFPAHALTPEASAATLTLVRAGTVAGIALMAAGVLSAELLRRSVAPLRSVVRTSAMAAGAVEVTFPPELRTRAA